MLIKKSNIAVILILSILSIVYLNCGGGESTTDSVKAGAGADKSVTERQGSGTGENETAALMTVVDGVKQWDGRPKNIAGGMLIAYRDEYRATVEMETVGGDLADGKSFKFDMWYSHSPIFHNSALSFTVNNFVFLARNNFYDGLTFHRVLADFVVQGGDPTGTGTGGPGYSLTRELNDIPLEAGIIAMAQSSTVSGSQFFIALSDVNFLKQQGFSAFGKVVQGSEVLNQIRLRNPDIVPRSAPAERIISITISEE